MRAACLVLTAVFVLAAEANAQARQVADSLRRSLPATPQSSCPSFTPPAAPSEARRRQARDLARRGQQAAILGDNVSAREQLIRAATLDSSDAQLAYQLARAHEAAGAREDAARELCRFLGLAPDAAESADARSRLALLAPAPRPAVSDQALEAFQKGINQYGRGVRDSAERSFERALKLQPQWAEPFYDRGLARLSLGRSREAADDFEQYLRLKPEVADRTQIAARIDAIRHPSMSPQRALTLGLVIPGGGQFYTGRPGPGALALAGVGAAVACAAHQQSKTVTTQETALDPFGNPYTFTTTKLVTERPCMMPGLAAAGAIAIASAYEAFSFARSHRRDARISVVFDARPERLALGVSLR